MTTRGERLRTYLLARTGGKPGWQADLVARSGVKRQTISKWTNPEFDRYPDLEALAAVARALGVAAADVVAALDGSASAAGAARAPGPGDALGEAIRAQSEAMLAVVDGQRQLIERMDRRLELLERALLSGEQPDPRLVEAWRSWVPEAGPARGPLPTPSPGGRPESR